MEKIIFLIKTLDKWYSEFLIWSRFACLVISIFFAIRYIKFYKTIKPHFITFEHKFIYYLTMMSILFNDPIYFITILNTNIFYLVLSNIFVVLFVVSLIVFWSVMIERIYKEPHSISTKLMTKKKIILSSISFVVLLGTSLSTSIVFRYLPSI